MTGSLKWFIYTTDFGDDYALKLDESNTEQANGGTQDYPGTGTTIRYALPRNIKPRYAIYSSADGTINRKCVCLTPTVFGGVTGNQPTITDPAYPSVTLSIRRLQGEKISLPFGLDTGIQDGDAT